MLADVREIMDTCSLGQALDLLTAKAAEPALMSLVERSLDLQQACKADFEHSVERYRLLLGSLAECVVHVLRPLLPPVRSMLSPVLF